MRAKPFVKWAGGKANLLKKIDSSLPTYFTNEQNITYIEPFVGGGAVLFFLLDKYKEHLHRIIINDINVDLISCYRIIQRDPKLLITALKKLQEQYYDCETMEQRGDLYYRIRAEYNQHRARGVRRAALFIFLNHTCFNGLYRENSNGEFNVPCAYYEKPKIADEDNLKAVHNVLKGVEILCGDYRIIEEHIAEHPTFVYMDPPYRPLKEHSNNFSKYYRMDFGDLEQENLHEFSRQLTGRRCYLMQSNSDSRNGDDSSYFRHIYNGFRIEDVVATRTINPTKNVAKKQSEVLIMNYEEDDQLITPIF